MTEEPKFIRKRKAKKEETVESTGIPGDVSTPENETDKKMQEVSTLENDLMQKMSRVSTLENTENLKTFFVSTFIDKYIHFY